MPVKNMPPVWRDSVQGVLRIKTSISPEARIVGRSLALIGRYLTLFGSLKIAAAIALHSSTSRPLYIPGSSGRPKPARPWLAPQINWPRVLTWSSVAALADRAPASANAAPASQAKRDRMTTSSMTRTLWALAQDDWGHSRAPCAEVNRLPRPAKHARQRPEPTLGARTTLM